MLSWHTGNHAVTSTITDDQHYMCKEKNSSIVGIIHELPKPVVKVKPNMTTYLARQDSVKQTPYHLRNPCTASQPHPGLARKMGGVQIGCGPIMFNPSSTWCVKADQFSSRALRRVVAQLCLSLGWHNIQSGAWDVLAEIMSHYMLTAARKTASYCSHGENNKILCAALSR